MTLPLPEWTRSRRLEGRLAAIAILIGLEILFFTVSFDGGVLPTSGLAGAIRSWSPSLLRAGIAWMALFALLVSRMQPSPFAGPAARQLSAEISLPILGLHALFVTSLYWLSSELFTRKAPSNLLASAWLSTGLLSIIVALTAFVGPGILSNVIRATRRAWIPASIGAAAAFFAGPPMRSLWIFAQRITFHMVLAMLQPLLPGVSAAPEKAIIGSRRFSIQIDEACSGLEGVALVLIFCAIWLWFTRADLRFPHVLLIFPASAALIFVLNAFRLAILFLIGYLGAPAVAMGGFHSQAGWLLFNVTAIGVMVLVGRMPYFNVRRAPAEPASSADPTLYYLGPFLAILGATILSKSVSSGFEWAYPIRLICAAAVLLSFRRHFRDLDWRVGWIGPVVGTLAFALWIGWDSLFPQPSSHEVVNGLNALPPLAKIGWMVCRVGASIATVPLAEELAFRGYLARRIVSEDFTSVCPATIGIQAILISSLVFGVFHGSRWFIGTVVGVLYAVAFRHRGRIGDAVAAHALTNGLLALLAVTAGRWDLW
jgi:exosortase E/protease (VPEID-CTERM system)